MAQEQISGNAETMHAHHINSNNELYIYINSNDTSSVNEIHGTQTKYTAHKRNTRHTNEICGT